MKNKTFKTAAMHMAMVLIFSRLNSAPVSAMGFFDAEQNKSLNLEMNNPIPATEAEPPIEPLKTAEFKVIELSDKLTRVFGRTNDENNYVYYSFTSVRGQKVMIYNMQTRAQGPDWSVEYKIDNEWIMVPTKHSFISSELSPNQKILMRISRSPGMPVLAGDSFMVEFGSAPFVSRKRTKISGDAD